MMLAAGCMSSTKSTSSAGLVTGEDGTAELTVEIGETESTMLLTIEGRALLAVDSIVNPRGEEVLYWNDWYTADTYLTAAVWPLGQDLVLNWPVRAEDGPLESGSWQVTLAAVNEEGNYQTGERLTARTQTKQDADFSSGQIKVLIAYAEGVAADAHVVESIEAGVARWQDVWEPYGLGVQVRYASAPIDALVPYVGEGSEDIAALSLETDEDELLMIVGERIEADDIYYGVAGNIPGSTLDTPRSAVVISWLANAGLDGEFSDDDIRLLGETMAHETSHYMGLFHPVETTFDVWDAVRDTEDCTSEASCESSLGDNLMFPYPVCSPFSCIAQDALSEIQSGIAHRYTGTQ
jgi:hypothetical protein